MAGPVDISPDASPSSLLDICLHFCVRQPEVFCREKIDGTQCLVDELCLPAEICEHLIRVHKSEGLELTPSFLSIFTDNQHTCIRRLNVRDTMVDETLLKDLLVHNLVELDISNCSSLGRGTIPLINKHCEHLERLFIRNAEKIINVYRPSGGLDNRFKRRYSEYEAVVMPDLDGDFQSGDISEPTTNLDRNGGPRNVGTLSDLVDNFRSRNVDESRLDQVITCPHLTTLIINNLGDDMMIDFPLRSNYLDAILKKTLLPLRRLTFLDLSKCGLVLESAVWLGNLQSLVSLILYDVLIQDYERVIAIISKLKKLRLVVHFIYF